MSEPLKIRFATDTASVKSGMQDLAATVASNMVKVSGAVAGMGRNVNDQTMMAGAAFDVLKRKGAAFSELAEKSGGFASAFGQVASTVANDSAKIGTAAVGAAKEHNGSMAAIGIAVLQAAAQTKTGTAAMGAAYEVGTAPIRAKLALLRNEISGVWNTLAQSPAFMAGLTAVGGVAAITLALVAMDKAAKAAEERLEEVMKIATSAEGAGVGTSFLQRWVAEAKELNIEAGKLEGMLTRAREAATTRIGEGEDKDATSAIGDRLKQNVLAGNIGQGDLDRYNAAGSQEDRIRVILDLVSQLQAKGANLAALDLAGKMFGSEFETKLRSGVDMVGKMREALDAIGRTGADGSRILSPEEIASAELLKRTLEETRKILGDAIEPLNRDIAMWQAQSAQSAAEFNKKLAEVAAYALKIYGAFSYLGDKLTEIGNLSIWGKIYDGAKLLGLTNSAVQDLSEADKRGRTSDGVPRDADIGGALRVGVSPARDTSRSLPSLNAKEPGRDSKDEIERLIDQLNKANEVARAELDTVGKSNVERERALDLAKLTAAAKAAGRDATAEETAQVDKLAEATARLKDRTMDQQQALRETADAMRSFGQMGADAFADIALEGKGLGDVLQSVEKQIARMLINAAFTGQGPLAGILGLSAPASAGSNALGGLLGGAASLLGIGKNAEGTDYWRGGLSWVGEKGPELLNLPRGAQIIPNSRAVGGSTQNVSLTIDVTGATGNQEVMAMVNRGVRAGLAQVPRMANAVVRDRGRAW